MVEAQQILVRLLTDEARRRPIDGVAIPAFDVGLRAGLPCGTNDGAVAYSGGGVRSDGSALAGSGVRLGRGTVRFAAISGGRSIRPMRLIAEQQHFVQRDRTILQQHAEGRHDEHVPIVDGSMTGALGIGGGGSLCA